MKKGRRRDRQRLGEDNVPCQQRRGIEFVEDEKGKGTIELEWINDDGIKSVPEWIARFREQLSVSFLALFLFMFRVFANYQMISSSHSHLSIVHPI